jgi:hypothetical protein
VQVLLEREEDMLAAGVPPLRLRLADQAEPAVEDPVGVLGAGLERARRGARTRRPVWS